MTASEFGFVCLRLFAVVVIIWAIAGILSSFSFFGWPLGSEGQNLGWIAGLFFVAYWLILGFGIYLFFQARRVSEKLFGSAEGDVDSISASTFQAVAFSVVGIYLCATALPSLTSMIAQLLWVSRAGAELERDRFLQDYTFGAIQTAVQFGAGVFLFARAEGISRYWRRLRGGAPGSDK